MVNGQALCTVIVRASAPDEYARAPRVKAEMSFMIIRTVTEVAPKKGWHDERIDFSSVFYTHRPQTTASCPVCQARSGDDCSASPTTKKGL